MFKAPSPLPRFRTPLSARTKPEKKETIKILQLNCYVLVKRKRQVSQQDTCSASAKLYNQPVGKRPFPFGGRSAIVIRQDMSQHVHALLQKGVRVRRLLSIRVYWQTFQLSRDIKTVVQLEKLMQHWTEVALGSDWPSHGLTTSGINCQPMARLSNFSPGRRTVRHSSQVGKIKPTPLTSKGWISIKKY